jgi:hypothetical protein
MAKSGLVEMRTMEHYKESSNRNNKMRPVMSIAKRFAPRLVIVGLIAASGGCLSIDTSNEGVAVLTVATGNDQTVQVGKTAAVPLVVRAFDNAAQPMEDVEITWSINPAGGGSVSTVTTTTDDAGFSQVDFTAGPTAQTVFVRASAEGLTVSFTMTVVAASG